MTTQVKVWLSLLLIALGAYGSYSGWRVYQAMNVNRSVASKPRHIERTRATGSLEDAALVDTDGKPFALDALKGDVWIASFFFTSCPGPCAQMNRALAELQNDTKDPHLKFVSITCDPANDTPEVLAKYAHTFKADPARWAFLSGPFESVQKLGNDAFEVIVGPKMHTERVILVDKWSNVRSMYLTSDPSQVLALKRNIAKLLAEESPPAKTDDPQTAASDQSATGNVVSAEQPVDAQESSIVAGRDASPDSAAPAAAAENENVSTGGSPTGAAAPVEATP